MSRPILTERTIFAGIPCLHIRRTDLEGPAPTVLFYHGWCPQKESQTITAEALAIDGLRLIVPDAPRHGERDPLPEYFSNQAWGLYWGIVRQAISEAAEIKDALVRSRLADPERLGLGGNSMGGMIGAAALALNPWAKTGAFTCTNLSHVALDALSRAARREAAATEAEVAQIKAHDPEALISSIAPRPLLLQHGVEDRTLPISEIRRFVELARPAYGANPERLRLEEYGGLGHHVTPSMILLMRSWFVQHLAA